MHLKTTVQLQYNLFVRFGKTQQFFVFLGDFSYSKAECM